jgi:Cu+-exporting ATPase
VFTLSEADVGSGTNIDKKEAVKVNVLDVANEFGKVLADEVDSVGFGAELVSVKAETEKGHESSKEQSDSQTPTTCIFEFSRRQSPSVAGLNDGAVRLNRIGGIMSRLINEMSREGGGVDGSATLAKERNQLLSHLLLQKGVISCAVTNIKDDKKKGKKPLHSSEKETFTNEFPHRVSLVLDPKLLHVRRIADFGKELGFNECRLISAYSSTYKIDNLASNGESNMDAMKANLAAEQHDYLVLLIISAFFSIPVAIISMGIPQDTFGAGTVPGIPGLWVRDLILVFLTAPVQFGVGWRFYKKSFAGLRGILDCFSSGSRRRVISMGMDFLIAAGTTAAYFASILEMALAVVEQKAMDSMINTSIPPADPTMHSDDHSAMASPSPSPSSYYNMPAASHSAMKPMVFFDTSALLITFVILGKFLESAAKKQTSGALAALLDLQPATALVCVEKNASNSSQVEDEERWVKKVSKGNDEIDVGEQIHSRKMSQDETIRLTIEENDDGSALAEGSAVSVAFTRSVPLSLIVPGDLVKVYPGAAIPCDGVVEAGLSEVNESMVSGESLPVLKAVGDEVTGATVNSVTGVLLVRVSRVGSNSVLSQIVELVEQAQMQKAPIQEVADTISGFFAPFVIVLALITLFIWLGVSLTGHLPPGSIPSGGSPFTFSLLFSISVVVVACPCALGLATPTAVMVGTGVAARLMVLFKGGNALEATSGVNTIVFDKTGTLTLGKPSLTDLVINSVPNSENSNTTKISTSASTKPTNTELLSATQVLGALRAAESCSEHPLAKAISEGVEEAAISLLDAQRKKNSTTDVVESPDLPLFEVPTESFISAPGKGISCRVTADSKSFFASSNKNDSRGRMPQTDNTITLSVIVGNRSWLVENLDQVTSSAILLETEEPMKTLESQGKTAVVAYVSSVTSQFAPVVVLLGIADRVRPEARSVLHALRSRLNIKVKMVTGDTARTAAAIAMLLNFPSEDVVADCLPQRKAEIVKKLQDEGGKVAVVGDGINDAPALAAANVGIAIGAGSHIAVATSDVVLVRSDLRDVLTALHLSRAIVRRIHLNFIWALGYNILGIPLAAGILWPFTRMKVAPEAAGLAMAFSSVSVVMSSLLLRRYKRPADDDFYRSSVMSPDGTNVPVGVVLQQPALTSLSQQIASAVEGTVHFKDERKNLRR